MWRFFCIIWIKPNLRRCVGPTQVLAAQLVVQEFVKATGRGEVTRPVAVKITCHDKTVAKRELRQRTFGELLAAEWNLLLCSAGSLAAVICEAAQQWGRRAIEVGSMDQILATPVAVGVDSVPLGNQHYRRAY